MRRKLVYSFWCAPFKESWKDYSGISSYDEFLSKTINILYLSILHANKRGFRIELFTDQESKELFKGLPIDYINTQLSFLSYKATYVEGKFYALSKQTTPFVYIDWDVFLLKENVVNQIENFKEDVLILSLDKVSSNSSDKINHGNILKMQTHVDFSPFLIDNFYKKYNYYPNTSILGFNNLDIKNKFVDDFLKCFTVVRSNNLKGYSKVIDQYLFSAVLDKTEATVKTLFERTSNKIRNIEKIGYTYLSEGDKYKEEIKNQFPKYLNLIENRTSENELILSLCTVVMNRFDHVVNTLKKNIEVVESYKGKVDLNVLDYNSTDGLEEYLFEQEWFVLALKSNTLKYYKNYSAKFYHRTLPKNIIHFISSGDHLINIDADNYVSKEYINYCLELTKIKHNFFLRPSLTNAMGAFGRIMIHREDFRKVRGYNLNIKNYGFEDCEIILRLKEKEVKQIITPRDLQIRCINHSDKLRVHYEEQPVFKNISPKLSDKYNKQLNLSKEINNKDYDITIYHVDEMLKKNKINLSEFIKGY